MELEKVYNFKDIEKKWYEFWLKEKYFMSKPDKTRKTFTIVIPPPNVTGALHMGHALNNVLQDVIIRFKRMHGFNVLWVPGTDHGGIATQNVVERIIFSKYKKTRKELGRDKFLENMNTWIKEIGNTILNQLMLLGCSCDWDRKRFTKDQICSNAVISAFIELFNQGFIYRGKKMINWCPRCQTALSDIEVEHKQIKSKLWYIKYPLIDEKNTYITVATTRPETMLGDTAVAVNPEDERYKKFIDKKVKLPLTDYIIPVICDVLVDKNFGTGAVKITPEHDPVDFDISQRHNLEHRTVIDKNGKMTLLAGEKYKELDRYVCREKIIEDLKQNGFLEKIEDYTYSIGSCYRCGTIVEPLVLNQWFIKMKDIADVAIEYINKDSIMFYPQSWKKPIMDWLVNIKDWCVSRQIWWGHRIPVWYCVNCLKDKIKIISETDIEISDDVNSKTPGLVIGKTKPEKCNICGKTNFVQDPDVLDTWFSSALWPLSVFGWPDTKPLIDDLKYYYPTSVLVTGYEILYLWVARMIMMGLKFTGNIPFENVYIHGIIRDIHGKKMSKSLGNVIDPLEIIKKCGTDALRFSLTSSAAGGRDIQLSEENFIGARNFCNKIWNAVRFICLNLEKDEIIQEIELENLNTVNKWILNEFNNIVRKNIYCYQNYEIHEAARITYDFFWSTFCDWYLEFSKTDIKNTNTKSTLLYVLVETLKLLHPIMPFITEELYQFLKNNIKFKNLSAESIMISEYPKQINEFDKQEFVKAKLEIEFVIGLISEIRRLRSEMNILPKQIINIIINTDKPDKQNLIKNYLSNIQFMTKVGNVIFSKSKPPQSLVSLLTWPDKTIDEFYLPLENIIDIEKEKNKLKEQKEKILKNLYNLENKLKNEKFIKNAPEEEINKTKTFYQETKLKLNKLEELYKQLL